MQEETIDLTVSEYAQRFNVPIDTVRSRIRAGKINTIDVEKDGRIIKGIRVPVNKLFANSEPNSPSTVYATVLDSPDDHTSQSENSPPVITELFQQFGDIREELGRYKEKAGLLEEVKQELTQYKLLTQSKVEQEKQWSEREAYYLKTIRDLESQVETIKATVVNSELDSLNSGKVELPWWKRFFG